MVYIPKCWHISDPINSWPRFVNRNMRLETKKSCSFQNKESQNNVALSSSDGRLPTVHSSIHVCSTCSFAQKTSRVTAVSRDVPIFTLCYFPMILSQLRRSSGSIQAKESLVVWQKSVFLSGLTIA